MNGGSQQKKKLNMYCINKIISRLDVPIFLSYDLTTSEATYLLLYRICYSRDKDTTVLTTLPKC